MKTLLLALAFASSLLAAGCGDSSSNADAPPAKQGTVPIQDPGPGMKPPGERGEGTGGGEGN